MLDLFLSFLKVGLFSVGGGYAAIPLIQTETLTHGWLTLEEFTNLVTIAEMTPGPIAINAATFVGARISGVPGMLIASLGCIMPSIVIVTILSFVYRKYRSVGTLQTVLATLRAVVVALIASAGWSILQGVLTRETLEAVGFNVIGAALFVGALFLLRKKKMNPILVMLLCGVANLVIRLAVPGLT